MYTLANDALLVSVLDPVADQARFGTRYCTGGYIFQVEDRQRGPLLSGPNYPDYPDGFIPYNGQGIPDAFNLGPLAEAVPAGGPSLIIGIGLCDRAADTVIDFCQWKVDQTASALEMRTQQVYQGFALQLVRTITLQQRTLRSTTRLTNTAHNFIPMHWFPHPFYPQPESNELCRFNVPVAMPDNPGFVLAPSGFVARRNAPDGAGYFQALDLGGQVPLSIIQKHPVVGLVAATCSYVPTYLPIWGNRNTFSWEPFLDRMIGPGQTCEWWIDYDF
jgi:hypothetical protein